MKHYDDNCPKPELVIALVGPAGTDLAGVATTLSSSLKAYDYKSYTVKVSDLITERCAQSNQTEIRGSSFEKRVTLLQSKGDEFREKMEYGGALVPLICLRIRYFRQEFLIEE